MGGPWYAMNKISAQRRVPCLSQGDGTPNSIVVPMTARAGCAPTACRAQPSAQVIDGTSKLTIERSIRFFSVAVLAGVIEVITWYFAQTAEPQRQHELQGFSKLRPPPCKQTKPSDRKGLPTPEITFTGSRKITATPIANPKHRFPLPGILYFTPYGG